MVYLDSKNTQKRHYAKELFISKDFNNLGVSASGKSPNGKNRYAVEDLCLARLFGPD